MYIIEFCGAPGAGKSTLCLSLEDELAKKGYTVKGLEMPERKYNRIKRGLYKVAFLLDRDCRRVIFAAHKYLSAASKENKKIWISRMLFAIISAKQAEKAGIEIVTFEEGCTQYVTSIVHGVPMDENALRFARIVQETMYSNRTLMIFNCKLDIEENIARLKGRGRTGDRFSKGTEEEMRKRLELKIHNIDESVGLVDKENVHSVDIGDFFSAKKFVSSVVYKVICN